MKQKEFANQEEHKHYHAQRSADGMSTLDVMNLSSEPSIDSAREAFNFSSYGKKGIFSRSSAHQEKGSSSMVAILPMVIGGLSGAALMYMFDPEKGRTRRALLRDKVVSASNKTSKLIDQKSRDLKNRAQGIFAEAKKAINTQKSFSAEPSTNT
jgi:gas vesicle protein